MIIEKGDPMKENMVRLSFDIPVEEHIWLKTECAQSRTPIKVFLHEVMIKELELRQKNQLKENLKKSIQQSKEGKIKSRGSFEKYAK